jgi:hypothetical protein
MHHNCEDHHKPPPHHSLIILVFLLLHQRQHEHQGDPLPALLHACITIARTTIITTSSPFPHYPYLPPPPSTSTSTPLLLTLSASHTTGKLSLSGRGRVHFRCVHSVCEQDRKQVLRPNTAAEHAEASGVLTHARTQHLSICVTCHPAADAPCLLQRVLTLRAVGADSPLTALPLVSYRRYRRFSLLTFP